MTGATVSATAAQASDIRARWAWVEPAVWTDRMLSALEEGVKGDVWFSLIDKVYRPKSRGWRDHLGWPNRFFTKLGLYALAQSQADVRKSFR
jgi:hypothetical protein